MNTGESSFAFNKQSIVISYIILRDKMGSFEAVWQMSSRTLTAKTLLSSSYFILYLYAVRRFILYFGCSRFQLFLLPAMAAMTSTTWAHVSFMHVHLHLGLWLAFSPPTMGFFSALHLVGGLENSLGTPTGTTQNFRGLNKHHNWS